MSDKNGDFEDDFESFGEDDDGGFDDFGPQQTTLADMWRNNPLVKIGALVGGFVLIVGAIIIFGGGKERQNISKMRPTADISEPPGGGGLTEVQRKALEEKNIQDREKALREGKSAMPVPIDPPVSEVLTQEDEPPPEDPLEKWKRLQEERNKNVAVSESGPLPESPPPDNSGAIVTELAELMASQMQSVLEAQEEQQNAYTVITEPSWLEDIYDASQEEQLQGTLTGGGLDPEGEEGAQEILIPSASIIYGQLLIEANSDVPGPVLAQVVTGEYAGSRMIGEFQATENHLVISFNSIVIDGIGYETQAVAVDPSTSLTGLATDIDRRYFKRVILPMAGAFVEGLAEAISESGTTTVTVSNTSTTEETNRDLDSEQEVASGIAEAGQELRDILDEKADQAQPLIRVEAGTPIGVLFIEPVVETN